MSPHIKYGVVMLAVIVFNDVIRSPKLVEGGAYKLTIAM